MVEFEFLDVYGWAHAAMKISHTNLGFYVEKKTDPDTEAWNNQTSEPKEVRRSKKNRLRISSCWGWWESKTHHVLETL